MCLDIIGWLCKAIEEPPEQDWIGLDRIEWARKGLDGPGIGWNESGQDWIEPDRNG
jgi:hypothetical protein